MLGEVPSGWSESRVDRVAQVVGGMGFPEKYQGRTGLKYPFLKVSDMNSAGNDRLLFTAANTVSEDDLRSLGAHAWPPGTTVFPKVGAALLTNKRRVLAVEAAFDNNVMGLVPREADPWFLYYFMSTVDFAAHAQTGALPSVNQSTIAAIRLLLPPLPEQKKIAAILSSVDKAIQATQAVIDQTRRVKEGLLQDLLTRGIGHTRFKQTEIGEIPEGWEVRSARDLARKGDLVGGPFGSDLGAADYVDAGVPVIRGGNVGPGIFIETDFVYVSIEKASLLARNAARRGDLIMTQRGASLGEATLIPNTSMFENYVISQTMMRLRPNTEIVEPLFLIQSICSDRAQAWLKSRAIGNAQPHLNLSIWQDMPLAVPPRREQAGIASVIGSLDDAVAVSEVAVVELQQTKSGLLQDLLTGKVRVTP